MAATTQVRLLAGSCRSAAYWEIDGTNRMPDDRPPCLRVSPTHMPFWSATCTCRGPGTHDIDIKPDGSGGLRHSRAPGHQRRLQVFCDHACSHGLRPHRLVVRTSRCGRDNPGSTLGVVMQVCCAVGDKTAPTACQIIGFHVCLCRFTHTHAILERNMHLQRPGHT